MISPIHLERTKQKVDRDDAIGMAMTRTERLFFNASLSHRLKGDFNG